MQFVVRDWGDKVICSNRSILAARRAGGGLQPLDSLAIGKQIGPGLHIHQPLGQRLQLAKVGYAFQRLLLFPTRRGAEFPPSLPQEHRAYFVHSAFFTAFCTTFFTAFGPDFIEKW